MTRAAAQEMQRLAAHSRGDVQAERAAEAELRRLWARYLQLDAERLTRQAVSRV
jgi:hypothetical protein